MNAFKTVKGNIPIIVWRRSSWTSMPHIRTMYNDSTECGRDVQLGYGIVAITLTQIPVDMFTVVGCGHCTQQLLRDLKNELLLKNINVHEEWKAKLKTFEWYRPGDRMPGK